MARRSAASPCPEERWLPHLHSGDEHCQCSQELETARYRMSKYRSRSRETRRALREMHSNRRYGNSLMDHNRRRWSHGEEQKPNHMCTRQLASSRIECRIQEARLTVFVGLAKRDDVVLGMSLSG
jgi:hypothetical protein